MTDSDNQYNLSVMAKHGGHSHPTQTSGVERTQLLSKLPQAKYIWLNAPAGYGKTELCVQYAGQQEGQKKALWLNLIAPIKRVEDFISQLLNTSTQQLNLAHYALKQWLNSLNSGAKDVEQAMILWLEEILQSRSDVILIIDNVHHLDDQDSWSLLVRLLELLPANVQVILAGRYLPKAPGRIHLLKNTLWLGIEQLSFNEEELNQLISLRSLAHGGQQTQHPEQIRAYCGWPALVDLWLEQGDKRVVEQYAQGELLDHSPLPMVEFLAVCAVFQHFNEAMLAYYFEDDRYHEWLLRAQRMMLICKNADDASGYFRVHPVLAEVILQQVPMSLCQDTHRQAFEWLCTQPKQAPAALRHALAANMAHEIEDWVLDESEAILSSLDLPALLDWISQLDEVFLNLSPRLLAIANWAYLLTQQHEQATATLERINRQGFLQNFERTALEGGVARLENNLEKAFTKLQEAQQHTPQERYFLRFFNTSNLTQLSLQMHGVEMAKEWNKETQLNARLTQLPVFEALALFDAMRIEFYSGRIARCKDTIQQALALLAKTSNQYQQVPAGRLYTYKALMHWLTGEPEEVLLEPLQKAMSLCEQQRDVSLSMAYAIDAVRLANLKRYDQALEQLDEARMILQQWQVQPFNYRWLDLVSINIILSQGNINLAQKKLNELRNYQQTDVLPKPEVFPLLPELALLTQVRILFLAGHYDDCLELIEGAKSQSNNAIYQHLLGLLRGICLHRFDENESQQLLNSMLRILQKEGISIRIFNWLPLNRIKPAVQEKYAEDLDVNLSDRELEVLNKIAQGLSNQEIADSLYISLHTVKTHARKINIKLAVRTRTQALSRARELALIS